MKARQIALDVVNEVLFKGAYSNIALGSALNKSDLNPKDRGLVTEIVYGTIRYKLTIDTLLKQIIDMEFKSIEPEVLNILRCAIYQMKYLDKVPEYAVVDESVEMAKDVSQSASKFVNGVLRNYIRTKDELVTHYKKREHKLSVEYSFPRWMINLFVTQYGIDDAENIVEGLNEVPYVTVRVNEVKSTFDEAYEKLEEQGYDIEEGYVCPEAIVIKKGSNIEDNELFKQGIISVQDESAMIVAPLMDLKENNVAIDMCSAPGGKATHMGEIMNNTGEVLAFDIHEHKLKLINDNASRLGLTNVKAAIGNAEKINSSLVKLGDAVLIDVPCSGLGIIKKKPEIKWNKSKDELNGLQSVQRNIMDVASEYVKKDGVLIYSTCTLNKDENEKNIQWFLEKHKDFKLEKIYLGNSENIIYSNEGYVTILPNKYMDGFFIAKLIKQ